MLITIKDKGCVYLISDTVSVDSAQVDLEYERLFENNTVWKVPNDDGIIAGFSRGGFEADAFRYDPDFVRGELSIENLVLNVVPKIRKKLSGLGKIDEDGAMNGTFCFAQRDKAFAITTQFDCDEIGDFYACGHGSRLLTATLSANDGQPLDVRLRTVDKIIRMNMKGIVYPLIIIDTNKCSPYLFE